MDLGSLLGGGLGASKVTPTKQQRSTRSPQQRPGPVHLVRYVRDGSTVLQPDEEEPAASRLDQADGKLHHQQQREGKKVEEKGRGRSPRGAPSSSSAEKPVLTEAQMVEDIAKNLTALQGGSNNEKAIAQCEILIDFIKKCPRHKATRAQKALVDAGCVDSLLNMVSVYGHFNDTVRACALRALAILCYTHEMNRNFLTSRGVVQLALGFIHPTKASQDDGVRRNALALLNNLAGSAGAHEHILANDGAKAIIARVASNELEVVAQQGIALLRNLAFHEHSREPLVKAGAVPALVQAIQRWKLDPESYAAMDISMSVACLVGHEENNPYVKTDARTIGVILKHFDLTLRDMISAGKASYVIWKMCMSISKLSVNDANKATIGQLGGIPILFRAMTWDPPEGADDDYDLRMMYAITSIWNLAFLPQNQALIKAMPDLITKLEEQRWVVSKSIRNAASGALFVLGLHGNQTPVAKQGSSKGPHVMLSYCWADQELMKRVKTSLVGAGFQVWMDIDDMQGHSSTLEAMAHAVENSSHVIVALSSAYKDSPNCRLESEYALQKNKRVIPIVAQEAYKPDGWLGILLGAKLYHDLTGNKYEDNVRGLIKDLRGQGSSGASNPLSTTSMATVTIPSSPATTPRKAPELSVSVSTTSRVSGGGGADLSAVLNELAGVKQQQVEMRQEMQELKKLLHEVLARLS